MKTNPEAGTPEGTDPSKSLTKVLGQSKQITGLVVKAAVEVASVNTALKQELAEGAPLPGVETALKKSEAVEDKVQDASKKLSVVNLALKNEVEQRHLLEDQLVAATEQGEVDRLAALHDVLTGLPNRALFNDRLEHGLAQVGRHGGTLAVMFVDLDGFKIINDTHGHDAGDSVLRTIAARLKDNTRTDDTVSRIGGDEFLCLLMQSQEEKDITLIAEKIIKSIQIPCDVSVGGLAIHVSVKTSIGIAIFPKDGATAEALIKSADTAMYQAKRAKSGFSFARYLDVNAGLQVR